MFPQATNEEAMDVAAIVRQIQSGDPSGAENLYHIIGDQCRARLSRGVEAQGVEDSLHDIVVTILEAIHTGTVREPSRLMGFAKTVALRRVARHIRSKISSRKRFLPMGSVDFPAPPASSPDAAVAATERAQTLHKALRCLRQRDRDLLLRYYYFEQDQADICVALDLTETQFRLFKSRALARCATVARRTPAVDRTVPRAVHQIPALG